MAVEHDKTVGDWPVAIDDDWPGVIIDDWGSRVLPEYWDIRLSLQKRYNAFGGPISPSDRDGLRNETKGGDKFASTLVLAMDRTRDAQAVKSIHEALKVIVDRPRAGETAWEMRKFIRRAPAGMIGDFGILMKELAERIPGEVYLDMDFYYCNWEAADTEKEREDLSREVLNGLRSSIDCINPV